MMNKSAILHIPLSQYAFAEGEHQLTIRLRAEKNDIKRCLLYYGDRVDPVEPIAVKEIPMKKVSTDDLFDYYETTIADTYTRICYYFLLDDGEEQLYYYERSFCAKMECSRTEYFQFPYIRKEDIIAIPDWAEDIVMYHIFPDSFASGKRELREDKRKIELAEHKSSENHIGGTLRGVMENLDYLEQMGINCIYLNPVFAAKSYHKYDTIDYFQVDPCFGSMEDLKELVRCCHKRGIRVILDGVFNHCGSDFFAFQDVLKKGKKSEYYDWFYYMPDPVEFKDPPEYEAFAYVKEMPKLNTGNPAVADYLCRVGTYWIREADIDGWRLDVANEINHDFWRKFRREVRSVKPDIFLIGEIWEDAGCWLAGDQFDSTMNYRFSYLCKDFFARKVMSVTEFDAQIQRMIMRYPRRVSLAQMNFLDSHDVPRFLSYCGGDRKRMELAFFYLFMGTGIPSVFYGDEYYIEGTAELEYRRAMPWGAIEGCGKSFSTWIGLRRKYEALRRGRYVSVLCDDERGCYGFLRVYKDEMLLVLLNNSTGNMALEAGQEKGIRLVDLLSEQPVEGQILLEAQTGRVYQVTGHSLEEGAEFRIEIFEK